MHGYFAIGIEGVSKSGNLGNLIRTAHAFGAAFAFTIEDSLDNSKNVSRHKNRLGTDTAKSATSMPFYEYDSIDDLTLPRGCQIVGVEITDEARVLPSFRHPANAVYILGSERMSLSDSIIERCDHMIKIPTKFSLNLATAGAIVMYDRLISYGKFAERPVTPSGKPVSWPDHVRGAQKMRTPKNA
jgi:tRNA G18 (ribose-2'-O)-methylase SpoU